MPSQGQAGFSRSTCRILLYFICQDGVPAAVAYFAPEERLKDAERETKIRELGTNCCSQLGSVSPPDEAITRFPTGPDGPWLIPQPPVRRQCGLPTGLWINHAFRSLQPVPTPPRALLIGRREGSLVTCGPRYSVCTRGMSIVGGTERVLQRVQGCTACRSSSTGPQECRGLLDNGPWAPAPHGQYKGKDCDSHST